MKIDSTHKIYINLLPNYANTCQLAFGAAHSCVFQSSDTDYSIYLDSFKQRNLAKFCGLQAFDFYPIRKDAVTTKLYYDSNWYKNLEKFLTEGKSTSASFWAFAQTAYGRDTSTARGFQSLPALRLQVYSDLAYGAQGIIYYTYSPSTRATDTCPDCTPINAHGDPTKFYGILDTMNKEVKNLSRFFANAKLDGVRHSAEKLPDGTTLLSPAFLDSFGIKLQYKNQILVSVLEKKGNYNLIILNKDLENCAVIKIHSHEKMWKIKKDGTSCDIGFDDKTNIEPGDALIYTFQKKNR
jgi:hypothetical protein